MNRTKHQPDRPGRNNYRCHGQQQCPGRMTFGSQRTVTGNRQRHREADEKCAAKNQSLCKVQ